MSNATVQDALEQPASVSEQAYQHLRSMIFAGDLAPGSVLGERRLADELQASRTPLRAAISRLEGEGLIERLSNGSVVIRQVSVDELFDILYVRRLLESEAATTAATSLDRGLLAALIAESHELLDSPNVSFEDFWRYNDRFHAQIAEAAGRPIMARTIIDLQGKARMCHVKQMSGRFQNQIQEHLAVLMAIEAGDGRVAKRAMVKHFDNVRDRLLGWLGAR